MQDVANQDARIDAYIAPSAGLSKADLAHGRARIQISCPEGDKCSVWNWLLLSDPGAARCQMTPFRQRRSWLLVAHPRVSGDNAQRPCQSKTVPLEIPGMPVPTSTPRPPLWKRHQPRRSCHGDLAGMACRRKAALFDKPEALIPTPTSRPPLWERLQPRHSCPGDHPRSFLTETAPSFHCIDKAPLPQAHIR